MKVGRPIGDNLFEPVTNLPISALHHPVASQACAP